MASASSSRLMALFSPTFPKDATAITLSDNPKKKAINRALKIQTKLIQTYGEFMVQDINFHPKYPFARIFPRPLTYFFWCLVSFYTIATKVYTVPLRTSIQSFQHRLDLRDAYKTQMDILSWFAPLSIWDQYLSFEWERFTKRQFQQQEIPVEALTKCYTIFLISLNCKSTGKDQTRQLKKLLFIKNQTIPDEVWSKPEEDAPWEKFPAKYTQQIKEVLDKANAGPSSTPKTTEPEKAQTIRFQSEGPFLEKKFQFIQTKQPELFVQIPDSPRYPCHPQPDTLRVSEREATPTPPWLTDKFWENEENVQQVLQIFDDTGRAEIANLSPTHEPINKSNW
ncbi:hypothetical protein TIFTF001_027846 [Ficus carica]|uniref:Uncharacterized protein n=1 Tax=Ficus carica TaxID=3494 RepID=A0AA88DNY6_FICCA|nr:hypothetical protein TIFTF001_027846 [Ficus carica]